jgi:hypothetical protein
LSTFSIFLIQQHGRSSLRYRFPNQPFELSRMNVKKHWKLGTRDQKGLLAKSGDVGDSDKLGAAIEKAYPPKVLNAVGFRLRLVNPDVEIKELLEKQLAVNVLIPSENTFCPLRLVLRSFTEFTKISGFIHQDHIATITLSKESDSTYSYGWILNNFDLELEIIEELRLAMFMITIGCCSPQFPLASRRCKTEDTRFCDRKLSKEMRGYIDSVEQIVLTSFNSNYIFTEDDKKKYTAMDMSMLFIDL